MSQESALLYTFTRWKRERSLECKITYGEIIINQAGDVFSYLTLAFHQFQPNARFLTPDIYSRFQEVKKWNVGL